MDDDSDGMEIDLPGTSQQHSQCSSSSNVQIPLSQSSLPDLSSQQTLSDQSHESKENIRLKWRRPWADKMKAKAESKSGSLELQSLTDFDATSYMCQSPSLSIPPLNSNFDRNKSTSLPSLSMSSVVDDDSPASGRRVTAGKAKARKTSLDTVGDVSRESSAKNTPKSSEEQRLKWRLKWRKQSDRKKEEANRVSTIASQSVSTIDGLDSSEACNSSVVVEEDSSSLNKTSDAQKQKNREKMQRSRANKSDVQRKEENRLHKQNARARKKMITVPPSPPCTPSTSKTSGNRVNSSVATPSTALSGLQLNSELNDASSSPDVQTTPTRRRKVPQTQSHVSVSAASGVLDMAEENEDEMTSESDIVILSRNRAAKFMRPLNTQIAPIMKLKTRIMTPEQRDYSQIINAVPPLMELGPPLVCSMCRALTYTLNCCCKGKVRIPPPRPPPAFFRRMLCEDSDLGEHFRKNTVKYNTAFGFGSMAYDRNREDPGYPFIKVNGMLHHMFSGCALPVGINLPLFHQLYKYDVNEANKYRMMNPVIKDVVMPNIMRNIQMIFEEENYLVKQYKTATEIMSEMVKENKPLKNVIMELRSPSEVGYQGAFHPGTLSRPKEEMQSFLYTMDADGGPPKHGIYVMHRHQGGRLQTIGYWNPLNDPTGYPLLFPRGNCGFKRGEYKLGVDYVSEEEMEEGSGGHEDYPFDGLDDEMDKGVEAIDYESARRLYKRHQLAIGEDVSDWDEDDEDDEDEDLCEDTEEATGEMFDDDDMMDEICSLVDPNEEIGVPLFVNSSDDEDSQEEEEVAPASAAMLHDDEVEDEIGCDVVSGAAEDESAVPTDEWREREEAARKLTEEQEIRTLRKIVKLQKFKEICLRSRDQSGFLESYFKDPIEIIRVNNDLNFLERKRMKHQDYLYYLADLLFDMNRSRVECSYPVDDDLQSLEKEVYYELSCIVSDPSYRKDDPKIANYRLIHHLNTTELDDNAEKGLEDLDDLVQCDTGEDMVKAMKEKEKKEWKPVKSSGGPLTNVSRRQYALHQMQVRDPKFHPYLSTMNLGQLYIIDVALRIIRQRNDNTRDHMIKMRGTQESSLTYQIHSQSAERKGFSLGYAFCISNDKPGSTAWFKEQFEKAMAIMHHCGKADLFITMTGDPHWSEIEENKLPHSKWQSNPFLVNDIFYVKMQELLNDVINNRLFGPVLCYCYSVEFQKRGMPHMHLLLTLQEGHKLDTSTKIDQHIMATIPPEPHQDDPEFERKMRFRKNVTDNMVHSACKENTGAYCMKGSRSGSTRCTKMFPYPFSTHTCTVDGGKVAYHRPDDGVTCTKVVNRKTVTLDNRYVVPYNPFLLNKYGCHINVEAVTTVDVVKYIYKYIYKGFDKALAHFIEVADVEDNGAEFPSKTVVHATKNGNVAVMAPRGLKASNKQWKDMEKRISQELRKRGIEAKAGERITAYDEGIMTEVFRQMTAPEAAWIIQKYPLSCLSHSVVNLSVHLPGKMNVFFRSGEEEKIMKKVEDGSYKTPFVAWFDLNKSSNDARKYTYAEIPLHYMFQRTQKSSTWIPYKKNMVARNIVRVRPVTPRDIEKFSIRLLALHQRGPRSFEELRTVRHEVKGNFHEAAKALGLVDSQTEFEVCLYEASGFDFPNRLRALFATILVFGGATDPRKLWDDHRDDFIDKRYRGNKERGYIAALFHINHLLAEHGVELSTYNLPAVTDSFAELSPGDCSFAIDGIAPMEAPCDDEERAQELERSLNDQQKKHFKTIMSSVMTSGLNGKKNCFFLQGSGGCGKTYLYRALYYRLRVSDIKVCMMATTGIAATLLINGTTLHKKFMLPINGEAGYSSLIEFDKMPAEDLRTTTVFIIDESTMASKFTLEAIDKLLREVSGNLSWPFGGKIMLLGGDWKQLLPVVPGAMSSEAVYHTLKDCHLWAHFQVLTLSKNMRAAGDPEYCKLLENVGNGRVNGKLDSDVFLNPECIVQSAEEIISGVYDDMTAEPEILAQRCILASLNSETVVINEKVLDTVPGEMRSYLAIDKPTQSLGMEVLPEYFSTQMPTGVPPFQLNLKVGCIVILLRNLNISKGLCNGSRLVVTELHDHVVVCRLLTTNFAGRIVWISKITVEPSGTGKKKATFSRFQLPLRLAYAMTINKSQGQTFDQIGIILNNNVFSHGQLYVALSRARESSKVRVFSCGRKLVDGKVVVILKNLVEQSVLVQVPMRSLVTPRYVRPGVVIAIDKPESFEYVKGGAKYKHDHSTSTKLAEIQKLNIKMPSGVLPGPILVSATPMASYLVREPLLEELTDMDDLALGETRLPITGVVHGFDSYDKDKMNVSLVTEDGKGNGIRVDKKLWARSWKNVLDVGKVIELEGNVVSGGRHTSFCITTDSIPKLVVDKTYSFLRSDLPEDDTNNCMVVLEFLRKHENKPNCKQNAPHTAICLTAKGETVFVKAFGGPAQTRLEKCTQGMILNLGPVKYEAKLYLDKLSHTFQCNVNTVVHIYNGPVNTGAAKDVCSSDELYSTVTGDKICYRAVLITDVKDGCAYLTDRPAFKTYPLHRVSLFDIPSNVQMKAGHLVKVTALIYTYDSIRLKCESIVADPESNVEEPVKIEAFSKYRALIRRRRADEMASPGTSSQTSRKSSQKSSTSEPETKKVKIGEDP